jgi:hypothetical protein
MERMAVGAFISIVSLESAIAHAGVRPLQSDAEVVPMVFLYFVSEHLDAAFEFRPCFGVLSALQHFQQLERDCCVRGIVLGYRFRL